MLNPLNAGEELGARVSEILLRIALSKLLSRDDLKTLCYAAGVSIDWIDGTPRSKTLEAQQTVLRG